MKKIIFLMVSILIFQISYSQKIQLLKGEKTFQAFIAKPDSIRKDSIILTFELSGTSASPVPINLTIDSSNSPHCLGVIDNVITFNTTDWPDANHLSKTVEKKINITIKGDTAFSGEDKIYILPDMAGQNHDKIVGGADSKFLIRFNLSGQKNPPKNLDISNTLKTDFAFYTDFLGVDNDRPNGLYQLDLGFKTPLNKYKCLLGNKCNKKQDDNKPYVQLFRSFFFNMNLSNLDNLLTNDVTKSSAKPITKIDSAHQIGIDTVVTVMNDSSGSALNDSAFNPIYARKKLINSFDLYQWASFTATLKLNLFAYRSSKHRLYIGYNIAMLRTPVYDSIFDKRIHVTSLMHGPDLFYETDFKIGNPKFNVRLNANYYWLKLWNNDMEQINAPIFKYNIQSAFKDYFAYSRCAKIFYAAFRIAYEYNSDGKSNGNQVFMRVANSFQGPVVNGVRFHNNFTQIQFGGVFDLTTILKKAPKPPTGEAENAKESESKNSNKDKPDESPAAK